MSLATIAAVTDGAACLILAVVLQISAQATGGEPGRVLRHASWTQAVLAVAMLARIWHPTSRYSPLLAIVTIGYATAAWGWFVAATSMRAAPMTRRRAMRATLLLTVPASLWGIAMPSQAYAGLGVAYLLIAALLLLSAWARRSSWPPRLGRVLRMLQFCAITMALIVGGWGAALLVSPQLALSRLDDAAVAATLMVALLLNVVAICGLLLGVLTRIIIQVESHALLDPLTGTSNRRGLQHHLDGAVRRTVRGDARHDAASASAPSAAMLVIDIDLFKQVNDTHGHGAGDIVLAECARRLQRQLRGRDLLARVGGEEFVALVHDADERLAADIAERLRREIEREPFDLGDGTVLAVTISIGWSLAPLSDVASPPVRDAADRALYRAKQWGRNRVVAATQLSPPAEPAAPRPAWAG